MPWRDDKTEAQLQNICEWVLAWELWVLLAVAALLHVRSYIKAVKKPLAELLPKTIV